MRQDPKSLLRTTNEENEITSRRPIMYKVKVYVTLKESVVDPQGEVAKKALKEMNYGEFTDVRFGKYIELTVAAVDEIEKRVEEICSKLLVNTVIEDFRYEVEEVVQS